MAWLSLRRAPRCWESITSHSRSLWLDDGGLPLATTVPWAAGVSGSALSGTLSTHTLKVGLALRDVSQSLNFNQII